MKNRGAGRAIWSKSFIALFIANSMLTLGQFIINAILATYAESLGASESVMGLIVSIFAASSVIMRCVSGPIMDTYSRKRVVMFATVVHALAFMGFGISRAVPWLFGFRIIQGCGMAFGNACFLAMVSQILPKDKYNEGIGYYSVAQVVAQSAGAPVGLWLVEKAGYSATFMCSAVIVVLATIIVTQIDIPHVRTKKLELSLRGAICIEALLPAVLMFCVMVGASVSYSFVPAYVYGKGISGNPGLFFTAASITMIATRPVVGKLTDRYGVVKVLIPALFCNIACYFVLAASGSIFSIIAAGFISAFGFGACQPAIQALSMKCVPNEKRGSASCTNYIGMDIGQFVGVSVSGVIAESMSYEFMWRAMTVPFFVGIAVVLLYRRRIWHIETNFSENR